MPENIGHHCTTVKLAKAIPFPEAQVSLPRWCSLLLQIRIPVQHYRNGLGLCSTLGEEESPAVGSDIPTGELESISTGVKPGHLKQGPGNACLENRPLAYVHGHQFSIG